MLLRKRYLRALLLFGLSTTVGLAAERAPVATTPHFAFHSDLETNLNDALIAAGAARKAKKDELFKTGNEAACFAKLPKSARAAWERAVDYYVEIVSPGGFLAREQYLVRVDLAGFDEELKDRDAQEYVATVRGFRAAAKPAYAACRWPAQDAKNRLWIEELRSRLATHEARIAPRLAQLYQMKWSGLPIPVDVVETVSWAGADSILRDSGGGHLLVSPAYEGNAGLECVFHEASHIFMGREAPVRKALGDAAKAADVRLPADLWHVVLFHTTGEVVRRTLEDAGQPGYDPILNGILARGGSWVGLEKAVESGWQPYVIGRRTLPEAAAAVIGALRKPAETKP